MACGRRFCWTLSSLFPTPLPSLLLLLPFSLLLLFTLPASWTWICSFFRRIWQPVHTAASFAGREVGSN